MGSPVSVDSVSHAAATCHLTTPCRHHQSSSCSAPCSLDHSACRPHPYAHTDRRSDRPPIMLVLTSPPHSSLPPFLTFLHLATHSSPPPLDTTPACRFPAFALFAARAVLPSLPPPQSRRTSQRGLVLRLGFYRRRS